MTILAQTVVNDARAMLNDADKTRWTDAELLGFLNQGRRDWSAIKPKTWSLTARRTITLSAGCYQTLTGLTGVEDAFALQGVVSNVAANGAMTTVIRPVTRAQLDGYRPSWQSETGTAVQNWFPDEANELAWWVYPAVTGGKIAINVSVTPGAVSLADPACPLDVMATTLMHYILYRAYLRDGEIAQNKSLSDSYLQLFTAAMSGA